ncbi:MAG: CopD family protein [Thermoleophilia bacterium]
MTKDPARADRWALALCIAMAALLVIPARAHAHAFLLGSDPPMGQAVAVAPRTLTLRFSERVQLLKPSDMQVVTRTGRSVEAGPAVVDPAHVNEITVPLQPHLSPGTYTVRYVVVSADSHIVGAALPFAVGSGPVGPPFLGQRPGQGPSETGAWSVSSRFMELVGLCGLVGLLGFRWLVWRPIWGRGSTRTASIAPADREHILAWGRDAFWLAMSSTAVAAMAAELYLLVVYSATALGTSVSRTLGDAAGIGSVISSTRLGHLIQLRGVFLFGVFALGAWQLITESGSPGQPKTTPRPAGAPVPAAVMALLLVGVLWGLSSQGHASQAPLALLQEAADLIHMAAAAVWVTGLLMLIVALWRLPHVAPRGGAAVATELLTRFSRVALISVAVVVLTGTVRAVAELSDPAQLWDQPYGRSILYKVGLLTLAGGLALRNRRLTLTLSRRAASHPRALTSVRRAAAMELVLAVVIVLVAALLVGQPPGRFSG